MSTSPDLKPGDPPTDQLHDIEEVSVAPFVTDADDPESIYVAPNWKLVWWRFKKHKLAVFSSVIVIMIAIVAMLPGFFSTLR